MGQNDTRIDLSRDAIDQLIPNSADKFKMIQKVFLQSFEVINPVVVEILWKVRRIRYDFR